jgi:hypothetical protein
VVADAARLAGGLATALCFIPAKILQERYTFKYAIVHADHHLVRSADFLATFFIA